MPAGRLLHLPLALLLASSLAASALAEEAATPPGSAGLTPEGYASSPGGPFALCPPFGPPLPDIPPLPSGAPTQAEADRSRREGQVITLEGNVRMQSEDRRLLAGEVRYSLSPEKVEAEAGAEGMLRYWDPMRILFARKASFWPDEDRAELEDVQFWLPQGHYSGTSVTAHRLDAEHDVLDQVSISTCPMNRRDWELQARRVDLDYERGRGVAHHAWLNFKDVPLLYAPYFTFSLDDKRATGFLTPSIGFGGRNGFELAVPWYWNIAPERDATFTVRPMSKRGVMLQGEYRQLWASGRGQFNLDWMPYDNERKDDHRFLLNATADSRIDDWNGSLAVRRASDRDFFRDFRLDTLGLGTDYLESHVSAQRGFGQWNLLLNAQQWQTITYNVSEAGRPYRRLPQILLTGGESLGPMRLALETEAVHFAHEVSDNPQGERYALRPAISLPIEHRWYSITPGLAFDWVDYQLEDESFERTAPIASLDMRMFFDRYGERRNQQIEPRLYYLYVPYREQNAPLFDAGLATPSLSRLFSPNRFTGRDRLGDANALSMAMTWRALDAREGYERASVALGHRYRFEDEKVTLYGGPGAEAGAGEVIGELGLGLTRAWRVGLTAATDSGFDNLIQTYGQLSYRGPDQRLLNLHYAKHQDDPGLPDLEQAGVSFAWPVSPQWRLLGSFVQDLMGESVLLAMAGVEYDSCCWKLRLGARQYVVDDADPTAIERDSSFMIQIEFKGLGGLGQEADRVFERDILGYSSFQP